MICCREGDQTDFLIPPFALFYFYIVFAAAFALPTVSRQAAIWPFHRQILREEEYPRSHYGQPYSEYCDRVRRYL
jgi:protein-S-isoprenylcysteine O-methyltransferase Ste14